MRFTQEHYEHIKESGFNPKICPMCIDIDIALRDLPDTYQGLYEALKDIVDPDDCSLDHHGHCQTHGWLQSGLCPHSRAKQALALAEGKDA